MDKTKGTSYVVSAIVLTENMRYQLVGIVYLKIINISEEYWRC